MRDRITKQDIVFPSGELRLKGTLVLPTGVAPRATVVMLHGSGQTGRESWTYRGLAHVLAQNGIASLLYEKRTVPTPEGESKFELLAKDAVAAVAFLKTHPELHASKIGLFGVSQGGWIAPLAASQCEDVAFAILQAGPAVSVWDQEVHRVKYTMQADGLPNDQVDQAVTYTEHVFAFARSGRGWRDIARRTKEIEKESWAQYLSIPTSREDAREWQNEEFDPKVALTQTACPVLAIFGADETVVPPAENVTLMKRFLKEAGNPLSKVVTIENVGHGMELNRSLVGDEWKWPTKFWVWPRKAPSYYDTILTWIEQCSRTDR